jgi:hypothetical protein
MPNINTVRWLDSEQVAILLRECLEEGSSIEINGLGVFRPGRRGGFEFESRRTTRVFIAYADEDLPMALRLFVKLAECGFEPWLDRKKLLPGQNWPRAIERAIGISDYFIACFSTLAAAKRGMFQSELRFALDCASFLPLDEVFLIPVRLEECKVPTRITKCIQYVDLFPDFDEGFRNILKAMEKKPEAEISL